MVRRCFVLCVINRYTILNAEIDSYKLVQCSFFVRLYWKMLLRLRVNITYISIWKRIITLLLAVPATHFFSHLAAINFNRNIFDQTVYIAVCLCITQYQPKLFVAYILIKYIVVVVVEHFKILS